MGSKRILQLNQKQIDILVKLPESGNGYHSVDILLIDGRAFENVLVFNSELLQIDDAIHLDVNEITDLKLHK